VSLSKSATEIVCFLIFQVTVLDQLYSFKLLALRIAMLLNCLVKSMPHFSDFKDGGNFEYFTSIPIF
jgi:hypothetical protein